MPESISRRAVLGLWAAPAFLTRRSAAAETCVVGTWGGDYARLLRENIDDPILKPTELTVIQDIGDETPRYAKMTAQRNLPHGTMDIACFGAVNGYPAPAAGPPEPLHAPQEPHTKHVL